MKTVLALLALGAVACGASTTTAPSTKKATTAPGEPALAWDECKLDTGYIGDDRCILPPSPEKGFQAHFGPSDYDNPDAIFVLAPGQEATDDIPVTSDNDQDVFFYARQYRLRPTAHHIILSVPNPGSPISFLGRRVGTANTSQDFPAGGVVPPEDKNVGIPLPAHSTINASFHAINTTDKPQLREAWINFYYRDPNDVTEPATEWFEVGDPTFVVDAHQSATLGPYTCNVQNDGRLLWLYGHRHANNTRFTVTRVRGDQRDVIYDADYWEEPLLLSYSSIAKNPAPDIANGKEGGWNGILDLVQGDKIEWSCDVTNINDTAIRFTEQTYKGEMCIVDAEAVGSNCF